ncbi:lytic transglycosylase domain-containing protein [Streptomyces gossypii]|uniref:lytic transglycosylase domain-containing protein n=1 Tax=Streptomyces gossypii TaxID=2883101 RepID=UPI0028835512|nr:lytic transglycosylase domain-containing protein [Streptomyces gossypii]
MSTAAVAAAAMAALTASQAPGLQSAQAGGDGDSGQPDLPPEGSPGDDSYHTELPPLESPEPGDKDSDGESPNGSGIPATVLAAYKKAEASVAGSDPGCALPWELLAAIGKVESGQARGGAVDDDGTTLKPILGPVLNGGDFAEITDTDSGVYDGDATYDRAVGPMQFIPSTWASWGADGNGDGRQDPNNIYDAALAAGEYLCAGERDLSVKADLDRAVLSYNQSREYLRTVLSWLEHYREGVQEVPDGEGTLPTSPGPGGRDDGRSGDGRDSNDNGPSRKPSSSSDDKPSTPSDPGGNTPTSPPSTPPPTTPPPTTPPPTTPPPTTPAPPAKLERVSSTEVTATAGGEFTERLRVRTVDSRGNAVDDVRVQYKIVDNTTDARFSGGATTVTVTTGNNGTATAPRLRAGERTGAFVVRASVVGRNVPATDFTATVKPRPAPEADELARTSDTALETVAGGVFAAGAVEIQATYRDKAAAGVPLTATMVTEDGTAAETGPYFDGADGKPLRSLADLETDADGVLRLPKIKTDEAHDGPYYVKIATGNGVSVTVKLTVKQPEK